MGRFVKAKTLNWAASLLIGLLFTSSVFATTPISQGFITNDKVATGSLVALEDEGSGRVDVATTNNADNIYGVVINRGFSHLSLTNGRQNQVQVATNGILPVLVSNINGDIKKGDHITASPIKGVGMKATSNVRVVGVAQSDLTTDNGRSTTYKDKEGQTHDVLLGEVSVHINVSYFFKQPEKTIIPTAVQNLANAIAGRSVKPVPIIISGVIFVITMIVVATIIFSMIRSSIISVGRNPLSQAAVYRNVIQISALVLAILSVAFISIYMVLTRL